jgi:hypothetical protein
MSKMITPDLTTVKHKCPWSKQPAINQYRRHMTETQIQLRTEGGENEDLVALAPSQGFHSICKWVKPVF